MCGGESGFEADNCVCWNSEFLQTKTQLWSSFVPCRKHCANALNARLTGIARQAPAFRPGKDSADGAAVLAFEFLQAKLVYTRSFASRICR